MSTLDELLDQVIDRESFLQFVKALEGDRRAEVETEARTPSPAYGPGARGWENGSIESFLDAAVAWTEDSVGHPFELPQVPSWRSFALFLYAGKWYE